MEWALDLILIVLLAATLFHAMRLERALGVLKRDRAALEELVRAIRIAVDEGNGAGSLLAMREQLRPAEGVVRRAFIGLDGLDALDGLGVAGGRTRVSGQDAEIGRYDRQEAAHHQNQREQA